MLSIDEEASLAGKPGLFAPSLIGEACLGGDGLLNGRPLLAVCFILTGIASCICSCSGPAAIVYG